MDLHGKCVLLGVSGGIAAYKMANVASALKKLGADVEVIMTRNATQFITPLTFETLTGHKCMVDTFDRDFKFEVTHISLAKKADVILVAPATANVIAKMAHGIADDMLTTVVLAAKCPKLVSPAMNTGMLENPITQDNIATLEKYGFTVIPSESGVLACKDVGSGRLPKEDVLLEYILHTIARPKDLAGLRIAVTAGPTQEALDAAKAEAEDLLAQWESGERTAESFGALAEAHSDDTGSNTNGGLYEAVYDGQMFAGFNDWIFNDEHTQGDTGLIENTQSGQQGWHVIYFQSWNDPKWTISVRNTLLNDQLTAWVNGLTEGLEVVEGSGLSYVG